LAAVRSKPLERAEGVINTAFVQEDRPVVSSAAAPRHHAGIPGIMPNSNTSYQTFVLRRPAA
jgi:hypothetical protein